METVRAPAWTLDVAVAVFLLAVLSLLVVPAARAAEAIVELDDEVVLTIDTERCGDAKVLAHIKPEFRQLLYTASAVIAGETHSVCWTLNRGVILVFWQDGSIDELPASILAWKPI